MTSLEKRFAWAGLGLALLGTIIAVLQYCAPLDRASAIETTGDLGPVRAAEPAVPAATGTVSESGINRVFSPDMIGRDIDHIEVAAGVPTEVWTYAGLEHRQYLVDGCTVTIQVRDGVVDGASLDLAPNCNVAWNELAPSYADLPPPNRLTFQDIFDSERMAGFWADCLASCGNAADPANHLVIGGSHADGWLYLQLDAIVASPTNVRASGDLASDLEAVHGRDAVALGEIDLCTVSTAAMRHVGPMQVNRITLRTQRDTDETFLDCAWA